ncbi:MAG: IgGFc-binding protein [Myxococcales bacterium]|nr:IgGFc-binding protein [Myxococcales bacterium]MCB9579303.1 IgGFc-binding protein [Polyangiaceae bacterium]
MRGLIRWISVLPLLLAIAASCSATNSDKTNNVGGGSGTGGGGGTAGNDGGLSCGFCAGNQYTPCDNGKAGTPVDCPKACAPTVGCTECVPGTKSCVGNEVHRCSSDGSNTDELVETCDVANGVVCSNGKCSDACQVAEDQPSNVGCEFWAVDLDQQDGGGNDPASAPWGIVLSNASQSQANVTIELNSAPQGQTPTPQVVKQVSVAPGSLETVALPTRELDCGVKPNDYLSPGTCLSSNAYRITSSAPIVVYQFNVFTNAYSNDASLLLPTNALGKIYRVIGWGAGHPVPFDFPGIGHVVDRSYVTVVGTQPNTQVTVRPSYRIKGNPPIPATPAGGDIVVTIGPFDVLNLETDDATLNEQNPADLSSSVVISSAPVAVFSGVETTSAPGSLDVPKPPGWQDGDTCCLDHLEEQMFPAESLGNNYVIARSPVRSTGSFKEPDVIRFLGVAETADVTTTLAPPYDHFTLAPGELKTTYAQDDFTVTTDKPIMVGQILVSNQYVEGNYIGDPSLTVFPPVEQYRTQYVILTPPSWTKNYVVITAEVGSSVILDGSATACPTTPSGTVNGVSYESRRCPLTQGVHNLSGDKPFGIVAYGYGSAGSYAFAGGADVERIYEPPEIK